MITKVRVPFFVINVRRVSENDIGNHFGLYLRAEGSAALGVWTQPGHSIVREARCDRRISSPMRRCIRKLGVCYRSYNSYQDRDPIFLIYIYIYVHINIYREREL